MFFSSLVARLVSLPYGFTLFSNTRQHLFTNLSVSLPYGFTLSQTVVCSGSKVQKFHYLMDLHYSQTDDDTYTGQIAFHYLMDLHYSQTINSYTSKCMCFTTLWIYTILKPAVFASRTGTVSLPYGFTLFSNKVGQWLDTLNVSLPYGFTLFSNSYSAYASTDWFHYLMDLHYSQTNVVSVFEADTFHYLMDLHYSQT